MSANVETMFSGEMQTPWHKEGTIVAGTHTTEDAIRLAGLDWEVVKRKLYIDGTEEDTVDQLPGMFATVREFDNKPLGVVGPGFVPLQNRDAFKFFDSVLGEGQAQMTTAGSLEDGKTVWMLAKLEGDPLRIGAEDIVDKYLLLANGHAGNMVVRTRFTPIRVVCANTLNTALGGHGSKDKAENFQFAFRHTQNVREAVSQAGCFMRDAIEFYKTAQEQFQAMADTKVTGAQAKAYFEATYQRHNVELKTERAWPNLAPLMYLFENGRGADLPGVRGTMWGAYNAVTEFEDHRQIKDGVSRLNRNWFGPAVQTKQRAFVEAIEFVEDTDKYDVPVTVGGSQAN
jgi:phage/plasmid-like protein (TIGR03299 family)